jgi:hypothetical protein
VRRRPAARALVAALFVLALAAAGCSGSGDADPSPDVSPSGSATADAAAGCRQVSRNLVAVVQRYVDAYGDPVSTEGKRPSPSEAPDDSELQAAMRGAAQALQSQGCDLATFRDDFRTGLSKVRTRGPIARAVLLRLTASLTGTAEATARTVTVRARGDLPSRLAELAPGSVVRLSPGTYRLTESLALLQGVTLRGAGERRTVIETTAADAGVLVLTDGRVELRGLTLRHRGTTTGDLVVGGATASLVLTDARVAGARTSRNGQGGNGVLMTAAKGTTKNRGTTLQVTGSDLADNAAAGVLLTGGHVASIRRSRFSENRGCGVCFAGSSSGAVRSSVLTGNRVGVAVLDRARPLVAGLRVDGGLVGVQVSGRARPVVRDVAIGGVSRAAMIFADHARGRVDGADCHDVPFGIVVSGKALPYLGENSCTVAQGG